MHHCQELAKTIETNILFAMYGAMYKRYILPIIKGA
jgi:hypothetical protein